jgi:hypothetical protein
MYSSLTAKKLSRGTGWMILRLTSTFSKKLEKVQAAVAPNFAYYNLCKRHMTVKTTPAKVAGVGDHEWTVAEWVETYGE